ncbi:MAG: hypothetical protein PVSMB2_31670 [Ktedonobacteraceae bacterium]
MERVLIVSKTRMANGLCVSGLTRDTKKSIRLIPLGRNNQPNDTKFEVGQVWNIEFRANEKIEPPHMEDVAVIRQQYVSQVSNMRETLMKYIRIWRGDPNTMFDNFLVFGNTSAYISKTGGIPTQSTGYWIPTRELTLSYSPQDKPRYNIDYISRNNGGSHTRTLFIPYVGCAETIPVIPKETLVRVSLARWWKPDGVNEDRCYLQLSGWYL